ncbi:hypothetical protein PHYC_00802 [Phycisphaerales bacterium]|nr:hypothetical protein PHYC_00802 [Phycisphaerales bacterium]
MYADPASMNPDPAQPADPLHDPHATEWERTYAMFVHLSLIAAHVVLPVVAPLILWLIKREKSPYVDDHGKEAMNFQISLVIYFLASALLIPACGVGGILIAAVYVLGLVGMILASIAAYQGRYYRYPATIRLIK